MKLPHDLETAWQPQVPPDDFCDRVLAQSQNRTESRAPGAKTNRFGGTGQRIRLPLWALAVAAALVLAVGLTWHKAPMQRGEYAASERLQVPLGSRAVAVLEPNAHVKFQRNDVWQATGNVFYRVNGGKRFIVHTEVGTIEVTGTCFRVNVEDNPQPPETSMNSLTPQFLRTSLVSAAVGVVATVVVYEGRVALSSPTSDSSVQLSAGESGHIDSEGAHREGPAATAGASRGSSPKASPRAQDVAAADATSAASTDALNALRGNLARLERQKSDLELMLKRAKAELAKHEGKPEEKDEYDLDQDDWKRLAAVGGVKFRAPCPVTDDWQPSEEEVVALGLAPHDADAIATARRNSTHRLSAAIRPLCVEAVGSEEVAEAIDNLTCLFIVTSVTSKRDETLALEGMRQVAEVQAGILPEPTTQQLQNPVFAGYYAYANELKLFQQELSESFGPEQAKEIAFGKGCYNVIRQQAGAR